MRPNGRTSNSESMTIWRVSSESGEQVRKLGHLLLGELIRSRFPVMARRRLIVLLVSAAIIAALAIGIIMLQVTTDPVEIWAAPHSRSRQEKDFFDANFQPFYRTNQVFIKSVGIESVRANEGLSNLFNTLPSIPVRMDTSHWQ
jgi:hypothetical protein